MVNIGVQIGVLALPSVSAAVDEHYHGISLTVCNYEMISCYEDGSIYRPTLNRSFTNHSLCVVRSQTSKPPNVVCNKNPIGCVNTGYVEESFKDTGNRHTLSYWYLQVVSEQRLTTEFIPFIINPIYVQNLYNLCSSIYCNTSGKMIAGLSRNLATSKQFLTNVLDTLSSARSIHNNCARYPCTKLSM